MSSLPLAPALEITDFLGTSETMLTVAKWKMNILDVALLAVLEPFHSWNTQDLLRGFPGGSDGKASVCNAGDPGSIPGSGRSRREGNGSPLQYSCLENPMDGGAWYAIVHGVAKSWTRLSNVTARWLSG